MKQNYKNYRKYYPPHHFIFLPVMTAFSIAGFWNGYHSKTDQLAWLLFAIISSAVLYLAIMLRQHYALGNQDRIVRLEFRLRYFELFGKPAVEIEKQLTFSQIAALRFADDAEFKILLKKALSQKLTADEIKKSISDWQADDMRV